MRDSLSGTDLVTRARNGEKRAWDALVERYAPLIWSICRRYRLGGADAQDVGQIVWLHLVEHLDRLRDPDALPGWLATTTRHECGRMLRAADRPTTDQVLCAENIPDADKATVEQELLTAERHAALREAFTRLPPGCQRLLALLIADPPMTYAEISARLGISVGSIGPIRGRCLDKLRRDPAIAALIDAESPTVVGLMNPFLPRPPRQVSGGGGPSLCLDETWRFTDGWLPQVCARSGFSQLGRGQLCPANVP